MIPSANATMYNVVLPRLTAGKNVKKNRILSVPASRGGRRENVRARVVFARSLAYLATV